MIDPVTSAALLSAAAGAILGYAAKKARTTTISVDPRHVEQVDTARIELGKGVGQAYDRLGDVLQELREIGLEDSDLYDQVVEARIPLAEAKGAHAGAMGVDLDELRQIERRKRARREIEREGGPHP